MRIYQIELEAKAKYMQKIYVPYSKIVKEIEYFKNECLTPDSVMPDDLT